MERRLARRPQKCEVKLAQRGTPEIFETWRRLGFRPPLGGGSELVQKYYLGSQ